MARGCAQAEPLFNQLANHPQKLRMHSHGGGAHQVDAALAGDGLRFDVEIVDHLHVIGDESDGDDGDVSAAIQPADHFGDVGFKPGLARRSAAALIDQPPIGDTDLSGDQAARFLKLLHDNRWSRPSRWARCAR